MPDFLGLLNERMRSGSAPSPLAQRFLSDVACPRFVVGRNDEAAAIVNAFPVDGLIDDFAQAGDSWHGLPACRAADVPKDAMVVNCSTSISPLSVVRRLGEIGVRQVIPYFECAGVAPDKLPLPAFVGEMERELDAHGDAWNVIYDRLGDDESKATLLEVVGFRLTADPSWMKRHRVRLDEQYFEEFLGLSGEVFVDAGGYDGDSTEIFCKSHSDYRKVYFFEPSTPNLRLARERLAGFERIEYHQAGLSDSEAVLAFDPNSGSASAISPEHVGGLEQIRVCTLDDAVSEPVSFIKMDIEGWELNALKGCRRHLLEDRPKLAIAVYHHAADFREIMDFVYSFDLGHDLALRHYTEGWSETVMYFMPRRQAQ